RALSQPTPTASPRPIVLILDTCEELARFRTASSARNISETLRILRGLREGPRSLDASAPPPSPQEILPALRVIFAGRLLLAQLGANYSCDAPLLEAATFLRLHEIRGFTPEEASLYLRDKGQVPLEYVGPILEHCPEVGSVVQVSWQPES